jgi:hypothetical protein
LVKISGDKRDFWGTNIRSLLQNVEEQLTF